MTVLLDTRLISFEEFTKPVPMEIIEYQAKRQAALRIPRAYESPEWSATYSGRGFIRIGRLRGYILVEMPLDLLQVSECDLAPERLARLESIGGTNDPIWVHIDKDAMGEIYSVIDGNNRCHYRFAHNMLTIPAFVTGTDYRPLYDLLMRRELLYKT